MKYRLIQTSTETVTHQAGTTKAHKVKIKHYTHHFFGKTYKPNGAREVARRARKMRQ